MALGSTRQWLTAFLSATSLVYAVRVTPVMADAGADAPLHSPADLEAMASANAAATPAPAAPAPAAPAAPVDLFAEEPVDALPAGQQVNVGSFGEIDLHVKDLDLTKVLQLLSIQSQRNIIASKSVSGTVSADLYGVDFYEALDAILQPNGFGFQEKGQFIYVYTAQELADIEKAERKQVSRILRLNYITAADAATFVQPLLSDAGSIAGSGESEQGFRPDVGDGGANSYAHTDTIVVRDYQENVDEILAVIADLDVRPSQVLVEATVLSARLTEQNAFGVDISVLIDYEMADFLGSPANVIDKLTGKTPQVAGGGANQPVTTRIGTGGGLQTGVGNTAAEGGFKVGVVGDNVSAFVRALDQVTDTTVLANPKILVLNRQKADIQVGGRLGYLSTTQTETAATETVEFLEVGTQLVVRPFVGNDGFVRMELRPELSDGETVSVDGTIIPNQTTQNLTTNVVVRSGQTVVLGGLFKEDVSVGRRQVPGLGDVPVLGAAFKGQDDNVERSEVIFLVKPTIMKDESLYAAGESMKDSSHEAILGARKGLLPWSRTKLTSAQLTKAQRHLEQGNTEKALWSTNLALYLDPTLTEAMDMKEEITGEEFRYHDFSIMNAAIDDAVSSQSGDDMPDLDPQGEATMTVPAPAVDATTEQPVTEEVAEANAEPTVEIVEVTEVAEATTPEPTFEAVEAAPAASTTGTVNVLDLTDVIFEGSGETPAPEMTASVETELE